MTPYGFTLDHKGGESPTMRFLGTSDPDLNRVSNRIGDALNSACSTQDIGMVSGRSLARSGEFELSPKRPEKGRYFAAPPRMSTMA